MRPENDDAEFVETSWVGRELRIGDDVVLEITDHCPRCVMTTLAQGDLPKDSGILRTAARHNEVHIGVLCRSASRRESPARRHRDPRLSTNHADGHFFTCTTPRYWFPARLAPLHRAFFRAGVTGIRWSRVSWGNFRLR